MLTTFLILNRDLLDTQKQCREDHIASKQESPSLIRRTSQSSDSPSHTEAQRAPARGLGADMLSSAPGPPACTPGGIQAPRPTCRRVRRRLRSQLRCLHPSAPGSKCGDEPGKAHRHAATVRVFYAEVSAQYREAKSQSSPQLQLTAAGVSVDDDAFPDCQNMPAAGRGLLVSPRRMTSPVARHAFPIHAPSR